MSPLMAAPQEVADVERRVLAATNDFRRAEGRPALALDLRLAGAARDFAAHMARTGRFEHDADGRQPGERAKAHGYVWCQVAENIAYEFHSGGFSARDLADRLMQDWLESRGHRKNLLEPRLAEIGIGVAHSKATGRWYAVQLFATPCHSRLRGNDDPYISTFTSAFPIPTSAAPEINPAQMDS